MLTADRRHRVYENSLSNVPAIDTSWFSLPPVWEWFYTKHHPEYKPLPPFVSDSGEDNYPTLQFIYPTMNAHITLPHLLDGSLGFLTAELAHRHPGTTVFWHLDQTYLTQTTDFHQISLQPTEGKHTPTAVDGEGNSTSVTFYIRSRE